jgi:amino acid adenylation domain-containing protein
MYLHDLLMLSALHTPDAPAVAVGLPEDGECVSYKELDLLARDFTQLLLAHGIQRGDRVGIWLKKSVAAVAMMQASLRLGAVYVPLDPLASVERVLTILRDCSARLVVTTEHKAPSVQTTQDDWEVMCVEGLASSSNTEQREVVVAGLGEDDMAYILYTSGSTGKPKGVCISHRNALAFIQWARDVLQASGADRFANHAPFHFDLSVLDLYVAFSVGALVMLIPDSISFFASALVEFVVKQRPTIWYSVPSVLVLMMEQGGLLELEAVPMRCIIFAGEPFPVKHFQQLYQRWNDQQSPIRFLNFYGPTETNVCTYYEVTGSLDDASLPIGKACSGDQVWAQKDDGTVVVAGEAGELMVAGPSVMLGYWGQARQDRQAYATGDLVRLQADGNYLYLGRRDHMVKVRGYRIELGEIETALMEHEAIKDVAVIVMGAGMQARLVACIVASPVPSLLEVKRHCAQRLPRYMIVDSVQVVSTLPRTRNGKIDRVTLSTSLVAEVSARN